MSESDGSGVEKTEGCPKCGALVGNQEVHDAWHKTLTPEAITKTVTKHQNMLIT